MSRGREGPALVVLRRVRVQADAGFDVDVPPLELQDFTRDAPARDVRELHGWTDRRRQVSEDAFDLLALGQLSVDLAVRVSSLLALVGLADHHIVPSGASE